MHTTPFKCFAIALLFAVGLACVAKAAPVSYSVESVVREESTNWLRFEGKLKNASAYEISETYVKVIGYNVAGERVGEGMDLHL
jgi:hypothetical protein